MSARLYVWLSPAALCCSAPLAVPQRTVGLPRSRVTHCTRTSLQVCWVRHMVAGGLFSVLMSASWTGRGNHGGRRLVQHACSACSCPTSQAPLHAHVHASMPWCGSSLTAGLTPAAHPLNGACGREESICSPRHPRQRQAAPLCSIGSLGCSKHCTQVARQHMLTQAPPSATGGPASARWAAPLGSTRSRQQQWGTARLGGGGRWGWRWRWRQRTGRGGPSRRL